MSAPRWKKIANFPKVRHGLVRKSDCMQKTTSAFYTKNVSLMLLAGFHTLLCAGAPAYAAARQQMVAQQRVTPEHDISNPAVLAAMGQVPRH